MLPEESGLKKRAACHHFPQEWDHPVFCCVTCEIYQAVHSRAVQRGQKRSKT